MGQARKRLERRKRAQARLAAVMERPDKVIVVHYSCQSFYDLPEGQSPRVTAIAVRNLETAQTLSFSIQRVAERERIAKGHIEQHYDQLEKKMLDEFYRYVKKHQSDTWLHWNMRDQSYGFPALAHRYEVLDGKPVEIAEDHLVDLARIFYDIYGKRYAGHPRLATIATRNRISRRDFLEGKDEAKAFEERQYLKLQHSALRKVDIIAALARNANDGDLKTDAPLSDRLGPYPIGLGEFLVENWWCRIITFVATVGGVMWAIYTYFVK